MGRSVLRAEDARLVTGRGLFTSDVRLDAALHAGFVRAWLPSGRIRKLDLAAARAVPGIVAIITAADVLNAGAPAVNQIFPDMLLPEYCLLAGTEVTALGQPIAMVVGETLHAIDDAIAAAVVAVDAASAAPGVTCFAAAWGITEPGAPPGSTRSVSIAVNHELLAPAALEPRAAAAVFDAESGALTLWLSTQTPHRARESAAQVLGCDPGKIRVIAPDVGGAFGGKASIHPEELLVAWAAMRLKRPVRWTSTRSEEFLSASRGRGASMRGTLHFNEQGRIQRLEAQGEFPLGHRLAYSAAIPASNAGRILPGPYVCAGADIKMSGFLTPAPAVSIYRGAGRPEAAMLIERLMDKAARALGIDPLVFRQRNVIRRNAFPYRTPTGQLLDSGNYPVLIAAARKAAEWPRRKQSVMRARRRGEIAGLGAALYIEPCGQGWESAEISLLGDGRIVAATGSTAQGQGHETVFRQIVSDVLEISPDCVTIRHGDTQLCPEGIGALASRSMAIGGSAMVSAARALKAKALSAARRGPLDWRKLAAALAKSQGAPGAGLPVLHVLERYEPKGEAWSSGCCIAEVAIDTGTFAPSVKRLIWADDAGVIINPQLAEGQLLGGLAQGIGEALMENIVTDEAGQLLTGSFMDYAMPRANDIPPVTLISLETPSPFNLLGAKGVGEAGCIGVPAAISNAVHDALAPFGIEDLHPPFTGAKIWLALNSKILAETG